MSDDQVQAGQKFWDHPGASMARALRKSPAVGSEIVKHLVRELGSLRGDAVDLGATASRARAEVGKARYGLAAAMRRR